MFHEGRALQLGCWSAAPGERCGLEQCGLRVALQDSRPFVVARSTGRLPGGCAACKIIVSSWDHENNWRARCS